MEFKAIDEGYVLNEISQLEKGKASGADKSVCHTCTRCCQIYFLFTRANIQLITQKWNLPGNLESSKSYPDL